MSVAVLTPDPLKDLEDLKRAVYELQQSRGGAQFAPGGAQEFPGGVIIGDTFVWDPVPAPTNLELSWDSDFDRIYIDAEWDPPTGTEADQTVSYLAELVEVGVGVVQQQGGLGGNSYRFQNVKANQDYEVRVWGYNRIGRPSAALGPEEITTGADTSLPGAPTGLTLRTGIGVILAYWDENPEEDVQLGRGMYEVEISQSNLVGPDGSFLAPEDSKRTAALVQDFAGLDPITATRYVHVRAIDSSGNFSTAWSPMVSAVPDTVQEADIANGAVTRLKVALLAVDNARINDVAAGKLTSDSINTAILTIAGAGMLRMGRATAPFNYIIEDASGIRFYAGGTAPFTGGTLMVDLNVQTGNAFFGGSLAAGVSITSPVVTGGTITGTQIRTAATGPRIVMNNPGGGPDEIDFYPSDTTDSPGVIGVVEDGTGLNRKSLMFFASGAPDFLNEGANLELESSPENNSAASFARLSARRVVLAPFGGALLDMTDTVVDLQAAGGASLELRDTVVLTAAAGLGGRLDVGEDVAISQGGFQQLLVDGGAPGLIGTVAFLVNVVGLGFRRIWVGVPDSAGAGKRAVYVPND